MRRSTRTRNKWGQTWLCLILLTSGCNVAVKVTKAGDGKGTVLSEPAGIDCGDNCEYAFPYGATVRLIATPASDSKVDQWTGCREQSGQICGLYLGGPTSVGVVFTRK